MNVWMSMPYLQFYLQHLALTGADEGTFPSSVLPCRSKTTPHPTVGNNTDFSNTLFTNFIIISIIYYNFNMADVLQLNSLISPLKLNHKKKFTNRLC